MPTPTADTSPPQGTSLEDAARAIEGLLDLPEEADTQAPEKPAADAAPTDGESVAEVPAEETPAEQQEAETDASDEADTAREIDPKNAMVTVTIDGKSEAKPLEEVVKGYQRQADYTRKMDALREERKGFDTERQAITEERQTYATMLVALRDQLQEVQPEEPDWAEVYRTDPVGYARRRDEWRDKQDKIAAANFELNRLRGEERKEQEANLRKLQVEKRAQMFDLMPAWKDPKVWETDRQAIIRYAQEVGGYSTEEIANAYDPRAIVLFNKARLWDELQANQPKPTTVKRPQVASAGPARDTSPNRLNAAQQRLAKSGRVEDAAKVFEQLI